MAFLDKINQIEHIQQIIEISAKISDDVLKKINYKFRLEWNYTSNNLEGNSLTRMETRSVMVGNVTVEGKPIRDIMEMKGHDEVVSKILKLGKGELNISEKVIKEIHSGIMFEEDAEKKSLIGRWKTSANYLYNYRHERFDFTSPDEVQEKMHQLVNWLDVESEKIRRNAKHALHPIQLAFRFHLDYVTIHPFYEGNGRTARILTNLILISFGYPPLYIKPEEKDAYGRYLADVQVYGGEPDLFYEFMGEALLRSEQIVLNAIEGNEIEEPDDLFKEIELWKVSLGKEEIFPKTRDKPFEIYDSSLRDLFDAYEMKMGESFGDLFLQWAVSENVNRFIGDVRKSLNIRYIAGGGNDFTIGNQHITEINELEIQISMYGFKKANINSFNAPLASLKIKFEPFLYWIVNASGLRIDKTYNEVLTSEEMDNLIRSDIKYVFENIKAFLKKANK